AIYGSSTEMAHMPVAPLSIAERVAQHLLAMNPSLRLMVLGGDHSIAWPIVAALGRGAVGDRARRRAHGSLARAPGREVLLRDLGLSREPRAGRRRSPGPGRDPRVGQAARALG